MQPLLPTIEITLDSSWILWIQGKEQVGDAVKVKADDEEMEVYVFFI